MSTDLNFVRSPFCDGIFEFDAVERNVEAIIAPAFDQRRNRVDVRLWHEVFLHVRKVFLRRLAFFGFALDHGLCFGALLAFRTALLLVLPSFE